VKHLKILEPLKGLERPAIYIAGDQLEDENWRQVVVDALFNLEVKGTVIDPSIPKGEIVSIRERVDWSQEALWLSDVLAFYFDYGHFLEQSNTMFELGCQMGRYCVGGGPHKLLVGVDGNYVMKDNLFHQVKAHNRGLEGSWKINVSTSLPQYIERIKAAVS